ncbi:MAG: hypothetical protein Q4G03_04005 [Planctomycetia bacterium]|nr:hypothetical protein [Planctomycetia bacterium]
MVGVSVFNFMTVGSDHSIHVVPNHELLMFDPKVDEQEVVFEISYPHKKGNCQINRIYASCGCMKVIELDGSKPSYPFSLSHDPVQVKASISNSGFLKEKRRSIDLFIDYQLKPSEVFVNSTRVNISSKDESLAQVEHSDELRNDPL